MSQSNHRLFAYSTPFHTQIVFQVLALKTLYYTNEYQKIFKKVFIVKQI